MSAESNDSQSLSQSNASADDLKAIEKLGTARQTLKTEIAKVIVGQQEVVDDLLTAIFSRGHCLMIGVPGLAKTLMVSTIADAIDLDFNRIQFTPDLMPSDITGTEIIEEDKSTGGREFKFVRGPVFANILLADEINRTPPKTQASLLQAMQELEVTVGGQTYQLPRPFFVLATQNPIEQEGTYPLPEAQLDRFMFLIKVDYPSSAEEVQIAKRTTGADRQRVRKLIDGQTILNYQQLVRRVPVPDHIYDYAVALVRSTRPRGEDTPDWIKRWVTWGAGPRAVQYLILGAKVHAVFDGSYLVREEDIRNVANDVLRHRIVLNFHAESEGITSDHLVERLVEECVV